MRNHALFYRIPLLLQKGYPKWYVRRGPLFSNRYLQRRRSISFYSSPVEVDLCCNHHLKIAGELRARCIRTNPNALKKCKLTLFFKLITLTRGKDRIACYAMGGAAMEVVKRNRNILKLTIKKKPDSHRATCGVREIRTPEPLLTVTDFPDQPLQPLEHHSSFNMLIVLFVRFPGVPLQPLEHRSMLQSAVIRFASAKLRAFF